MRPEEFKANYNQIKDLIRGHGPQIANELDMPYHIYYNAIRGQVTDPDKLERVWKAIRAKADELIASVSDL